MDFLPAADSGTDLGWWQKAEYSQQRHGSGRMPGTNAAQSSGFSRLPDRNPILKCNWLPVQSGRVILAEHRKSDAQISGSYDQPKVWAPSRNQRRFRCLSTDPGTNRETDWLHSGMDWSKCRRTSDRCCWMPQTVSSPQNLPAEGSPEFRF